MPSRSSVARRRRRQREPPDEAKPIEEYTGRDRYIEWIRDYLNVELTDAQCEIVYSIMDNQKVLVVAGNGFGKSFVLSCFSLAFLFLNYPTSVLATSGTYQKLRRTYAKPVENLHQKAWWLPGRYLQHPPRITIESEPEVFWECSSPRDPGELEGVHNEYTLAIVEEADKESITDDMFDSMESLLTDERDKLVAIANPPRDENNVVYDLMHDDSYIKKQFSSFESHNVQVEMEHPDPYQRDSAGDRLESNGWYHLKPEVEDQMVDGLVRLSQIKQDWVAWNREPWPGVTEAMNSEIRDDLAVEWYRRRLGVMAPVSADVLRPFTTDDVENAFRREPARVSITPQGLGWDVVRGGGTSGDYNAFVGIWDRDIRVLDYWRGEASHLDNYERIRKHMEDGWSCDFAIDHVGVGSEAPDRVELFYPNVVRFNAGTNASDPELYDRRWTEGLVKIGDILNDGAGFRDERLREELLVAARVIELQEKYSGKYDTTRFHATKKEKVKDRLGRSPDLLDALIMAALMMETGGSERRRISSSW